MRLDVLDGAVARTRPGRCGPPCSRDVPDGGDAGGTSRRPRCHRPRRERRRGVRRSRCRTARGRRHDRSPSAALVADRLARRSTSSRSARTTCRSTCWRPIEGNERWRRRGRAPSGGPRADPPDSPRGGRRGIGECGELVTTHSRRRSSSASASASFSMSAPAIPHVKHAVRETDLDAADALAAEALRFRPPPRFASLRTRALTSELFRRSSCVNEATMPRDRTRGSSPEHCSRYTRRRVPHGRHVAADRPRPGGDGARPCRAGHEVRVRRRRRAVRDRGDHGLRRRFLARRWAKASTLGASSTRPRTSFVSGALLALVAVDRASRGSR